MVSPARIVVTASGACTALGRSARLLALGLRAGAAASVKLSVDNREIRVCRAAPDVDDDAPLAARLVAMAAPALAEAACGVSGELAVVLALPQLTGDAPAELAFDPRALLRSVAAAASTPVDHARSAIVSESHAAFALAVAKACELLLGEHGPRALLVGAVDSWLPAARLRALVEAGRVRVEGAPPRTGVGYLMPGEAAAFLLLERERDARSAGRVPLALLAASAARVDLDAAERTAAGASMLATLAGDRQYAWWLTGLNGEEDRAELAAGTLRAAIDARGPHSVTTELEQSGLARDLGDLGAAAGAVAAAAAAILMAGGGAQSAIVQLWSGPALAGFVLDRSPDAAATAPAPQPAPSIVSRDARIAFGALEQALRAFREIEHRVPLVRRRPILDAAQALGASLAALEDALDGATPVLDLERAGAAGARLVEELARAAHSAERRGRSAEPAGTQLAAVAREIGELLAALRDRVTREETSAAPALPSDKTGPVLLSSGAPQLLPVAYYPAARQLEAPANEAAELDDELDDGLDDADPAPLQQPGPDVPLPDEPSAAPALAPTAAADRALALEALDAIARLWMTRAPPDDARWSPALREADERLLAQLDLLGALAAPFATRSPPALLEGVQLDLLPLIRRKESAMEPGRAFADVLALGSAVDPRLARAAVERARGAAPGLRAALCDALALGANAALDAHVADLCLVEDQGTLEVALEVLRRRRSAPVGCVAPLLFHRASSVREGAARALGRAADRVAAAHALETRLATEGNAQVAASIVEGLLRLRAPLAAENVQRRFEELARHGSDLSAELRSVRLAYARMSAALGRAAETIAFTALAEQPREIECVGWFGRVTAVGPLLNRMEKRGAEDEAVLLSCARALTRVTGLVREVGPRGPRLVDGKLEVIDDDVLELDVGRWRTHWQAHGAGMGSATKYRFGRAFSVQDALTEHVAQGVRVADRELTSLEIALSGTAAPELADDLDWIARQVSAAQMAVTG